MNALEELIEFHEDNGHRATFFTEITPSVPAEDLPELANMVIIISGTPAQLMTMKAIISSVTP